MDWPVAWTRVDSDDRRDMFVDRTSPLAARVSTDEIFAGVVSEAVTAGVVSVLAKAVWMMGGIIGEMEVDIGCGGDPKSA